MVFCGGSALCGELRAPEHAFSEAANAIQMQTAIAFQAQLEGGTRFDALILTSCSRLQPGYRQKNLCEILFPFCYGRMKGLFVRLPHRLRWAQEIL